MRLLRFMSVFVLLPFVAAAQQPISLGEAVRVALEKSPVHKAAFTEVKAAKAGVGEVRSSLFPKITFSELATRGNDPVYVFGTKLRQQRFTAADFALDQLNTPTPVGNFTSRFSGQWRIFDSMQNYRSVERARTMQDAASRQLERADQELIARVVQAYYGALLAKRRVSLAEDSLKTAKSIEDDSKAHVESGMATESDLLSAQVLTASRNQELVGARNDLFYAIAELSITLGMPSDTILVLQEAVERTLPATDVSVLEREALQRRPDLQRVLKQQIAQKQSVSIARAAFGPRLDAFGSWQTDSHSLGWNGGNNWTAGLELQFDLFTGGAKKAQLEREQATAEQMEALRHIYEDRVRLEVRRAYYDHNSATQQMNVAKSASEHAKESLRILQNRYSAGLATVTDLLRAEEASHKTQTDYWEAVSRVQTSYANLELASGSLTPDSPVVTQ